jgi:hypothetical protein
MVGGADWKPYLAEAYCRHWNRPRLIDAGSLYIPDAYLPNIRQVSIEPGLSVFSARSCPAEVSRIRLVELLRTRPRPSSRVM